MNKKKINYKHLSLKELEILKDIYVDLKVKSMNQIDLKDFATENISLQIKSTIGNEEELEAWQEMENFFKDEFENVIKDIKIKMDSKNTEKIDENDNKTNSDIEIKVEEKKLDMWED